MKVTKQWVMIGMLSLAMFGCHINNPTLRQKAIDALQDGDTARATKFYNKALSQIDSDWQAMLGIAHIQFKQGNWIEAQHGYEKVISLQPANMEVSKWLDRVAECLFKQGLSDRLQDMLLNANEQYGTSHDFLRQANYLTKLGDMDQAQIAYRKAVHFADVTDAEPWIAMAAFYELVGDRGNAIDALRHAYAINPANQSVADRLRHYGIVPGPTAGILPTPNVPPLPQTEEVTTETAPVQ